MDESLEHCITSLEDNETFVYNEARKALLNICKNVLTSPNDEKNREVRLDDPIVIQKLLPAVGALECLFDIGYIEDGDRIFLPLSTSLKKLRDLTRLLNTGLNKRIEEETEQKIFFSKILQYFHCVMYYEDPSLQQKARNVIPIVQLEIATMSRMREMQKKFKLKNINIYSQLETDLIAKDLFLIELLHWFKFEFFEWITNPICPVCTLECSYVNVAPSSNPHCSRIELHRCDSCRRIVEFPRYSHPELLLTLRRGRCGEWANVFTLLCRSLNYDTRFVCDETDHVWTEVWSISRKKWIHLDPCENIVDKPLTYEKGWKKKLTYIIAYSKDEVQDVTWRYTEDQANVLERRVLCKEENLLQLLSTLSAQRQSSTDYSPLRRKYVIKRNLLELVEMLKLPNSQNQDSESYEGRNSGSLAWRLARGEVTQECAEMESYIWDVSKYDSTFELQYNIVKDIYTVLINGVARETKYGWMDGMNAIEGKIIRKVENDWKMVYLARSPQTECGRITWSFNITNPKLCFDIFSLKARSKVFHNASVSWKIEAIFSDNKIIVIPISNCNNFCTREIQNAIKLNLIVTLSGGEGEISWQHAQVFRQSLANMKEPSLTTYIRLRNRKK